MKQTKFLLTGGLLLLFASTVYSQRYKSAADTVKLNKEYTNVSNDIAELTSKLSIAQNNLPGYHTKAREANSDAQGSANASSTQASKATNGDLGDAKRAKKKANKAYTNAQDAREADNRVKDQDKKITKLSSQLQKKQERLKELDDMRVAIRNNPL
jgi:DNA repair exonuclease SbcCD ATPase subunit